MNFFEQELKKLVDAGIELDNVKFVGRACYGDLGGQNRAKLEFTTGFFADNYSRLTVEILNRTDGKVDSLKFRFEDIWGKKQVSNTNFRDGIVPYIRTSEQETEWYVYNPTPRDFEILAEAVSNYLSVFTERESDREKDKSAFNKAMTRGKEKSEAYKARSPAKNNKTKNQSKEAKD